MSGMYQAIRNVHLLLASFSLPFLLMYAVSSVQMTHTTWFTLRPAVEERQVTLTAGGTNAREIARELMERDRGARGELTEVRERPEGVGFRLVVPGTVHEVRYERVTGATAIKTSVAGFMGMLNRLHHAAGVRHQLASMNVWGAAVGAISAGLLLLGATGLYMWFSRRRERLSGALLLALNLIVVVVLLAWIRRAGP